MSVMSVLALSEFIQPTNRQRPRGSGSAISPNPIRVANWLFAETLALLSPIRSQRNATSTAFESSGRVTTAGKGGGGPYLSLDLMSVTPLGEISREFQQL
jgi:hypothetical protein